MKKLILIINLILFSIFLFAQAGAEHQITNIIGAGRVEINIGEQFEIKADDIFQVFGKGQIIHPATGKLVERDNIYLGKIKVIEVKELSSIAEIIEKKSAFSIGNKVVKVISAEQEVIENKRPIQAEFQNPKERNYSETIYTQKEEKGKPNTDVHIVKISEENNQTFATIDKGNKTKAKGGEPSVSKKYYVFVPIVDTSSITGDQMVIGEEYIGSVKITSVEHDASTGKLVLNKTTDYSFIEKDNLLRTYIPKVKGLHHIFMLTVASMNFNLGDKPISAINGIYTMNGYMTSPYFFIGAGIGYNVDYNKEYKEAIIKNIPFFIYSKYTISNNKTSPTFNLSVGKNLVLNKKNENRLYEIVGGLYLSSGFGLRIYIAQRTALLVDINYTLSFYKYENLTYEFSRFSNISDNLNILQFNLGLSF